MMKNNKKIFNAMLVAIFCFLLVYRLVDAIPTKISRQMQNLQEQKSVNLFEQNEISQSFKAVSSYLSSINVTVGVGNVQYDDKVDFVLKDEDDNIITEQQIDVTDFKNGSAYSFEFDPQRDSEGKTYTAYFKGSNSEGESNVYFYISKADSYNEGTLLVNNKDVKKDLTFSSTYNGGKIANVKDSLKKLPVNGKMFMVISLVMAISVILFVYETLNKYDK